MRLSAIISRGRSDGTQLSAGGATNLGRLRKQRRRLMMPPHPVQLAWEVLTTSPTDEAIQLLTEVVEEAQEQNLEPAEIETRLRGTASGTG